MVETKRKLPMLDAGSNLPSFLCFCAVFYNSTCVSTMISSRWCFLSYASFCFFCAQEVWLSAFVNTLSLDSSRAWTAVSTSSAFLSGVFDGDSTSCQSGASCAAGRVCNRENASWRLGRKLDNPSGPYQSFHPSWSGHHCTPWPSIVIRALSKPIGLQKKPL